LLARFRSAAQPARAAVGDPLAALRAKLDAACEIAVFAAIDADERYAYIAPSASAPDLGELADAARRALSGAALVSLLPLADIAGASAGAAPPYRYVVETDVLAAQEADFNAWYDREHLPGLAAVEGTVRALRFANVDGTPRYHACYDLARRETLGCPAWLAVRATAWSNRVRPAFRNTKRTMFHRVA